MGNIIEDKFTHSQLSYKLTKKLQIISYFFLTYAIVKVIFIKYNDIINDVLLSILLFLTFTYISLTIAYIVLFISLIDVIWEILTLIMIFQKYLLGTNISKILLVSSLLNIIIYSIITVYTFLVAKEYRALINEQKKDSNNYHLFTEESEHLFTDISEGFEKEGKGMPSDEFLKMVGSPDEGN